MRPIFKKTALVFLNPYLKYNFTTIYSFGREKEISNSYGIGIATTIKQWATINKTLSWKQVTDCNIPFEYRRCIAKSLKSWFKPCCVTKYASSKKMCF